jgi:hypothetical protein
VAAKQRKLQQNKNLKQSRALSSVFLKNHAPRPPHRQHCNKARSLQLQGKRLQPIQQKNDRVNRELASLEHHEEKLAHAALKQKRMSKRKLRMNKSKLLQMHLQVQMLNQQQTQMQK